MIYGGRFEAYLLVPAGASISVTNNGGGPTTVTLTSGLYTPTKLCAHVLARLTAVRAPSSGAWSVSLSVGRAGTGRVTIAMSAGTFSIAWTSTQLRDALGFDADIAAAASATGLSQARGLWFPDCPLLLELDPPRAPKVTDARSVRGPTGFSVTYVGNRYRCHRGAQYSHVPRARVFEGAAIAAGTPKASFEQWLDDTQWGMGHAWFKPGSGFQLYWDANGSDELVGIDLGPVDGPTWRFDPVPARFDDHVKCALAPYLGLWSVGLPSLVAVG